MVHTQLPLVKKTLERTKNRQLRIYHNYLQSLLTYLHKLNDIQVRIK